MIELILHLLFFYALLSLLLVPQVDATAIADTANVLCGSKGSCPDVLTNE
jgi:hypothetical protein